MKVKQVGGRLAIILIAILFVMTLAACEDDELNDEHVSEELVGDERVDNELVDDVQVDDEIIISDPSAEEILDFSDPNVTSISNEIIRSDLVEGLIPNMSKQEVVELLGEQYVGGEDFFSGVEHWRYDFSVEGYTFDTSIYGHYAGIHLTDYEGFNNNNMMKQVFLTWDGDQLETFQTIVRHGIWLHYNTIHNDGSERLDRFHVLDEQTIVELKNNYENGVSDLERHGVEIGMTKQMVRASLGENYVSEMTREYGVIWRYDIAAEGYTYDHEAIIEADPMQVDEAIFYIDKEGFKSGQMLKQIYIHWSYDKVYLIQVIEMGDEQLNSWWRWRNGLEKVDVFSLE